MSDLSQRSSLYRGYRRFRGVLERVPFFKRVIENAYNVKNTILDEKLPEKENLEQFFEKEDPFGFELPEEKVRFDRGVELVDMAANGKRIHRAFEIGCAEGKFTEMVADRCDELVAVDISETAVERARKRCSNLSNTTFNVWNMRFDPVPGKFDLIIAIGVVEYINRPSGIKIVRDRLVDALEPGGYLLLGTTVAPNETSWLNRKLLKGTNLDRFFEQHPQLETVKQSLDNALLPFEHVLLRKTK